MKKVLDKFSKQAATYKKYRPVYPTDLFDFINTHCDNKDLAWDCGTGNGQVANRLAKTFKHVFATDISKNQIQHAIQKPNITYAVERAEQTSLAPQSVDIITVAQAIHWFDFDAFYKEVKRVLKPNGTIAVWGYGLLQINPVINTLIAVFYKDIIGPYWNKERRHIDCNYDSVPFDFTPIESSETFSIETLWTLKQLEGYFNSWSSVQNYMKAHNGSNPVDEIMPEIAKVWITEVTPVHFPVFLKIGQD